MKSRHLIRRPGAGQRRTGLAAGLVLCGLWTDEAAGQSPAPMAPESTPIETVLITAQKRGVAESEQVVPIAISTFDARALEDLHVRTLQDLTTAAPNVTLSDAGTIPSFANFAIRGLGINSSIPSVEPAVGVFVDGIYQGMSAGTVVDLFDVSDVEILRGPQATLFGRNTTGGAILINTRRPGDQFSVHGRLSVESGLEEEGGLSVEGPLAESLKAKLSFSYDDDSGWFTNTFDGRSMGARRTGILRPTLLWTTGPIDTTLIYEHGWMNGQGAVAQNPAYFHGFTIDINNPGYNRLDWDAVTLESIWHEGAGVVTNLFGYRRLDQGASDDIDAQPTTRFHAFDKLQQHQVSDELRYAARYFDRLDITAGLYYFNQSFNYLERRVLFGGAIDSTLGGRIDDTNYAVFADAEYHLVPSFGVIAGGRFTREEKSALIATFVPSTAGSLCNFDTEICRYNFPGPRFPGAPGNDHWDNFLPKLGFEWQAQDDLLVYGSWSRGVRSGGYNVRNASYLVTIAPGPYGPERQDAFELGWKSDWLNRRLRINGALFYDQIRDLQRDLNFPDPATIVVQTTRNTADATIKGTEVEVLAAITEGLILNANAGYTEGSYDRVFIDLNNDHLINAVDLGLDIPRLSKWSYAFGAKYTRPIGNYTVQLKADYGYRSRAAATDDNTAFLTPIENLSAAISVTLPSEHWTISLYGRNLLDKVTDGIVTPLPLQVGGGAFRTLNEGRVIGAEATFKY
ncbi:MAG TPA: TonB-dependent receptor [Micropepsaceae bacterium]|nr:TonB-dependent receptor [Micropepsaceae bacterium]